MSNPISDRERDKLFGLDPLGLDGPVKRYSDSHQLGPISLDQLNAKINADGAKVTVSFNKHINTKTRAGVYISVQRGLSVTVYFVGRDLVNATDIIEQVG